MNLSSIPCGYPNCTCPEPKLHIGAVNIGKRFGMTPRAVTSTKGLPLQRRGWKLFVRECVAKAFFEGRLGNPR